MPTPFTHLAIAQRLLHDTAIPHAYRDLLATHRAAFQLGSIVADARVSSGVGREVTHFYKYDVPMIEHPWRVMLAEHPILQTSKNEVHRVFLAGYVAHLCTDEAWALKVVRPHFWKREWDGVDLPDKFFALHLILTHMDERDEKLLETWQPETLPRCAPHDWLPFMPDDVLCGWRDLIANQISPDGISQTLAIFGKRLHLEPPKIRETLDDADTMHHRLWQHVPLSLLEAAETQIYAFTRDQLCVYLTEYI